MVVAGQRSELSLGTHPLRCHGQDHEGPPGETVETLSQIHRSFTTFPFSLKERLPTQTRITLPGTLKFTLGSPEVRAEEARNTCPVCRTDHGPRSTGEVGTSSSRRRGSRVSWRRRSRSATWRRRSRSGRTTRRGRPTPTCYLPSVGRRAVSSVRNWLDISPCLSG